MELWLASDEYANWKLDAVESLLGDCDVDLHSKGFWSSKLKADLLREEIRKMLIDLLQNDQSACWLLVVMAVADRRPCDALANLHNFFPEGDAAEADKGACRARSPQATRRKPLHSIRNRTWRTQHEH
ncbi:hypothetical protein ACNUI4_15885 [Pseudomonas aeruginosa]